MLHHLSCFTLKLPKPFDKTPHFQHPAWTLAQLKHCQSWAEIWSQVGKRGLDAEKSRGWRQAGEKRRETKLKGCTRQQVENKPINSKPNKGSVGCSLMVTAYFPLQVEAEVHRSPGFKTHAPASQAGWWGGPEGGEERKAESAAPNVVMQWSGSTNGGRAGCFVFFSRWGDAAACVACARLRGGAPVKGNLWKAHTHTGVDMAGLC